jgi:hypothetical protein
MQENNIKVNIERILIVYRFTSDNMLTAASGDLFISELNGDQWTNAVKLPENINSKGWEPSACLAKDGRLMFFTSSREGSIGGTDIYMIKKLPNGEWALPTNLGSTINTPYNEDSPYLHPDGKTLYFSSEGHNSMGGYDLFVTEYNEEKNTWSRPKNVGYPLSTAHDDIHFTFSADGKRAFFSTNRSDSYGDKDIYYAVLEEKEANHVLVVKGFVVDSLSNAPIKAIITVYDQNNSSVVGVYSSNESSGKYIMVLPEGKDFTLTVESENYKLCGDHISTLDIKDYTEVNKDIKLCPVNIPDKPIELPK